MPKVSVYLPDDLYAKARELGISLSAVTQEALQARIAAASVDEWLEEQMHRSFRGQATSMSSEALMDAVDEDFTS
jgi:post-segregation antitoxin (ccd killing protein)